MRCLATPVLFEEQKGKKKKNDCEYYSSTKGKHFRQVPHRNVYFVTLLALGLIRSQFATFGENASLILQSKQIIHTSLKHPGSAPAVLCNLLVFIHIITCKDK